jgi:hypothetical protein
MYINYNGHLQNMHIINCMELFYLDEIIIEETIICHFYNGLTYKLDIFKYTL